MCGSVIGAHSAVKIVDPWAHHTVSVACYEGDDSAGELDGPEGFVEEGCSYGRGGPEEQVHCLHCAGRWCSAWVGLVGVIKWEGEKGKPFMKSGR